MTIPSSMFWPGPSEIRTAMPGRQSMAMIGSRDGQHFLFTVPFEPTDAGRSTSLRPRQKMDCTVRALAAASGASYDEAYDELMVSGRRSHEGFDFRSWARHAFFRGYRFEWEDYPATKGFWRVNPVLFALKFQEGRYVLRTAKHVLACVDGTIYDETRAAEASCVYGAWRAVPIGGDL